MAGGTTAEARLARRLWEATQTDAALLADLTAAYRGRHDLRDALWWRAHPLTSTPAGIADPAQALRPLQDAVFSKVADATDSGGMSGTSAELSALTEELAHDRGELDVVLDRFGERTAGSPDPASVSSDPRAGTAPTGTASDLVPAAGDDGPAARPGPTAHRTHQLLLVVVGAVLGVLATIGVQAIQGEPVTTDASPGSQTLAEYYQTHPPGDRDGNDARGGGAAEPLGGAGGSRPTGNVLEVFFQPQVFTDGVVPELGDGVERETIRLIAFGSDDRGYQVYVARAVNGEYCLFLRSGSGQTVSTCSVLPQLEQWGASVSATVSGVTNNGDDLPSAATVRVVWAPDGSFSVETSPA
jgi:hypothetical protein